MTALVQYVPVLVLHSIEFLSAAVLIPLVAGIIARTFFLSVDQDDERRVELSDWEAEVTHLSLISPEPNPKHSYSWNIH